MQINDQVFVRKAQLRGNLSEIKRGIVVAMHTDSVSVQFPDEFKAQAFPVDKVISAKDSYGIGANVENPYEKPVVQMFRNR